MKGGGSTARRLYVNLNCIKWSHYYSNSILAGKGFCCAVLDHLHCASVQWSYSRAGQATYDCNIKWLSPDQLQSSPLHHINSVFVACSTVLSYLCLFPCSLLLFFFSRSSLFPSSHFLLFLVPFYRSNCSNQLYKRRLWSYGIWDRLEQRPSARDNSGRRHHGCETGMFKSVHHMFL